MKTVSTKTIHGAFNARGRQVSRGFALIVTMILMVLIILLCIGLLGLATTSQQTNTQGRARIVAQANAKLALMVAVGDLQKYAGPDQRVTASAEVGRGLQSPPRPFTRNIHWTGVWSTTALDTDKNPDPTKPMVGGNTDLTASTGSPPNAAYLTDRRNIDPNLTDYKWNNNLRIAWLVSGTYTNTPSSSNSPNHTNKNPTASATTVNKVKLVSTGSLGATPIDPLGDPVTVPLVDVATSLSKGGFAYWVGDESQKARIDQATPYEQGSTPSASPRQPNLANPGNGGYANLLGGNGPDFTNVKAGSTTPYAAVAGMGQADRGRIVTGGTVEIATNDAINTKKNFFDLTTESLGVLCDAREGGLKKDLTPFLERGGDIASDSAVLPNSSVGGFPVNPGLPANQPILPGLSFQTLGPNFAQIRNWAMLRQKVTGALGAGAIDPQYPPAVQMTGTPMVPQDYISDISKQSQAVHPFMVDFSLSMDFSRDASRAGGRALRTHIYPQVTLWNPYNVTIRGARYLIATRGFHLFRYSGFGFDGPRFGGMAATWIPGDPATWFEPGFGFNGWFYFVTDPVDMAPGECLVFVPDTRKSSGNRLGSNAVKYDVNNLANNILSATQIPGKGATNFYFDSHTKLNDAVDPTSPVYITCGSAYDQPYGMQVYCFKKTDGLTGSITRADVFNKPEHQMLQLINDSGNGGNDKGYWAWPVLAGSKTLETYESNDDRFPPPGFAQEVRTTSFADGRSQSALAHHNLRASIAHRSPFCCGGAYYDQRMGHFRDCYFASINLQDTNVIPPFIKGYDGVFKLRGSPFSRAGIYSSVLSYPMFDVPQAGTPLLSLAQLQNVQFGYQSWQSSFAIGHSAADIRSSRDASVHVAYFTDPLRWDGTKITAGERPGMWYEMLQMDKIPERKQEVLQFDTAFAVNQALWDLYYLSGIPYGSSSGSVAWNPTAGIPLPNPRLVLNPYRSGSDSAMQTRIGTAATTAPFDHSSYYLMNKGAFNINSTSTEAWRAFFSTLNKVQRPNGAGGGSPVLAVFSRLLVPVSDKSALKSVDDNGAWNGMKSLGTAEIELLAQKMVEQVKNRGPFLGLADFINRRLGPATLADGTTAKSWSADEPTVMGPLQAAIEKASQSAGQVNYKVTLPADNITNPNPAYRNAGANITPDNNAIYNWQHYGASGLLNQADFLQALAPAITARGDTFVVRGYGETRDGSGRVTARAWCEAVVQRIPDYVMPVDISKPSDASGNNPMEPLTVRSTTGNLLYPNTGAATGVLPVNQRFGRKMMITKFRWLDPSEV